MPLSRNVLVASAAVLLALAIPAPGSARPSPAEDLLPIRFVQPGPREAAGVFGAAETGTTYFGGTFWAADSGRWEAIQDSAWTFDTGVGSHFDHSAPHVNPFKDPSLHASMEGWIGIDLTYSEVPYFRRLSESDFSGPSVCVGDAAGLGGNWSFWCGVLPEEAGLLCYAGGQGYGNMWDVCIEQTFAFTGGAANLSYSYVAETEPNFDYAYVIVDTTGNGDGVVLRSYDGAVSGDESIAMFPGAELPWSPGNIVVKFCFVSDGAYSDQDGSHVTDCGGFAVDDVSINGGGITHVADFETGADGWTLTATPPGAGGDWSRLADLSALPPTQTPCECAVSDSVLLFEDLDIPGHGLFQDNLAVSPWIDLRAAGLDGVPGKHLDFDVYAETPLDNFVFGTTYVQWYPDVCVTTGKLTTSPFATAGFVHQFGDVYCTEPYREVPFTDFSAVVPPGAEQMRIAVGVVSRCRFFSSCTGITNSTPWYDNVRLGVFGNADAPLLVQIESELPQDAFPESGELDPTHPGRVDMNSRKAPSSFNPNPVLGDTLVIRANSQTPGVEILVQFAVDPGPGIDGGALAGWLTSHQFEETKYGLDWYSARMDTAEQGGIRLPGFWMTAYHESDPNFSGNDTDVDFEDLPLSGAPTRLANDIFPDDLFTPGTRLLLFYKGTMNGSTWSTSPDTTCTGVENLSVSGFAPDQAPYLEWECLPSSMALDATWNCVLYVDAASGTGAQRWIEGGLGAVLPTGSPNFENTAWDRYDIDNPQDDDVSFGRPLGTVFGATYTQAAAYRAILWDTGALGQGSLIGREDVDILRTWMTQPVPGNTVLMLAGDNLVSSVENNAVSNPWAQELVGDYAGALLECSTFREADCPPGAPEDTTACVAIDPLGGALAATRPLGEFPAAQGNACPELRRFDVLAPNLAPVSGVALADEQYDDTVKGTQAVASVSLAANGYRTLVDGVSLAHRRDAASCPAGTPGGVTAIEGRLREWLGWWAAPDTVCDPPELVDVGPPTPVLRTSLLGARPNPLSAGQPTRITFSLAVPTHARIEVFDVRGARVTTLVDATMPVGEHEAVWRGNDDRGRPVASGVYFYRLSVGGEAFNRKMVVVRGGAQ